jgi:2-polyprenyl-6-methoxyphenol hydroxylase-like FAD-dependent oxidoreductase
MTRHVMIIGGGIGGLALAQGLRRAGVPVTVYERTHRRTDWLQGYRIHINPAGAAALRACLDPAGWRSFLDTVSAGDGGFAFLTDQATELLGLSPEEIGAAGGQHYGVSRLRLREILLGGLDDVVRPGMEFTRYERDGDRVVACFADGTTATGDLLVGADGANSRVRGQLLPHAAGRVDTGIVAVAGRYPLTPRTAAVLPPALRTRTTIVVPRTRGSLFAAVWQGDRADRETDHAIWGFSDAAEAFPAGVEKLDGLSLTQVVAQRMPGWAPAFHRLIAGSDPATVNAFRVKSAIPVAPWPSGPVTLLGDAIHNMTPMAGIGANTALRDADLLRRTLIAGEAVSRYEREMLEYGFAAVRLSLRNAQRSGNFTRLGRAGFRTALRVVAAVPPLRRKMAAGLGR